MLLKLFLMPIEKICLFIGIYINSVEQTKLDSTNLR